MHVLQRIVLRREGAKRRRVDHQNRPVVSGDIDISTVDRRKDKPLVSGSGTAQEAQQSE